MIDDGSPDGTLDVAKKLQSIYGDKKIVSSNSIMTYATSVIGVDKFSLSYFRY